VTLACKIEEHPGYDTKSYLNKLKCSKKFFSNYFTAHAVKGRPDGVGRACLDMSDKMTPISHLCKKNWMHLFLGHCGLILQ